MDWELVWLIAFGLFCLFVLFAVWRTCAYDENESFLTNVGISIAALFCWFIGLPFLVYVMLGGCASHY